MSSNLITRSNISGCKTQCSQALAGHLEQFPIAVPRLGWGLRFHRGSIQGGTRNLELKLWCLWPIGQRGPDVSLLPYPSCGSVGVLLTPSWGGEPAFAAAAKS